MNSNIKNLRAIALVAVIGTTSVFAQPAVASGFTPIAANAALSRLSLRMSSNCSPTVCVGRYEHEAALRTEMKRLKDSYKPVKNDLGRHREDDQ